MVVDIEKIKGAGARAIQSVADFSDEADVLWHYTSAGAFRDIIKCHELWYTDPLFMNDGSEIRHGTDLMEQVAAEFSEDLHPNEQRMIAQLGGYVRAKAHETRPAILSMCRKPNLLNQWRDYGGNSGVRYCIGFRTADMLDNSKWNFQSELHRLVYKEDAQRLAVLTLVRELYGRATALGFWTLAQEDLHAVIEAFHAEVRMLLMHLKHPGFEAEEEWRFVVFGGWLPDDPPGWHTNSLGVVPHLVRRRLGEKALLPIAKVWIGPSPYADVSLEGTTNFLRQHGYDCEVEASEIPERPSK